MDAMLIDCRSRPTADLHQLPMFFDASPPGGNLDLKHRR
jgi:hypothetical protein